MEDSTIIFDTNEDKSIYFDIQNLIITFNHTKDKDIKNLLLELIKEEKKIIEIQVSDLYMEQLSKNNDKIVKNKRKTLIKPIK